MWSSIALKKELQRLIEKEWAEYLEQSERRPLQGPKRGLKKAFFEDISLMVLFGDSQC
jgi:hypothetical protein